MNTLVNAYRDAYRRAHEDPEGFWGERAEALHWERRWDRVLDASRAPFYRWFTGERINTCYNALDRHVEQGRGEQAALIYDSPVTGTVVRLTYRELRERVARFAGALAAQGVGRGDRVVIYMPMVPEAVVAMLACARIGAVHSVVFGGFAPHELAKRIDDAWPVMVIPAASGTTGKPKGVVRDHGGHAVALAWSMEAIYGMRAGDVFWAASDVGWVVGHSYIVYAPLLAGCTSILYEGKPVGTPDAGAFWRVVSQHRVNALFTAPTAFRAIKREDPGGALIGRYDLASLNTLFLAGERCDPDTVQWAEEKLGVPVIDHCWQTETGWPIVANGRGLTPLPVKPGPESLPVPGYDVRVLDATGAAVPAGQIGNIVIRLPLPPGTLPTLWRNDEGYRE